MIKRRKGVDGARRIRNEKLKEHQYREGYARSLEGKKVEWDRENNLRVCDGIMRYKLWFRERRLLGRKSWGLEINI